MSVLKRAEGIVKKYFKESRGFDVIKPNRGERGFDFRDKNSTVFIEVKGSSATRLSGVMLLMFTNAEYEKAKDCLRQGKSYEVHLVTGVGTDSTNHYVIPGKVFVDTAKPEIAWILPATKKLIQDEFLVKNDAERV